MSITFIIFILSFFKITYIYIINFIIIFITLVYLN